MVGKNSRQASGRVHLSRRLGSRLTRAWLGAREVFVFAAVGVVAPIAVLVALPQLLDSGQGMLDAPACASSATRTQGCLEPRPAHLLSPAANATWQLRI